MIVRKQFTPVVTRKNPFVTSFLRNEKFEFTIILIYEQEKSKMKSPGHKLYIPKNIIDREN